MNRKRCHYSPPPEEGWLRDQQKLRSHLARADGVVRSVFDHPVRSYHEDACGDIFLRSRPPLLWRRGLSQELSDGDRIPSLEVQTEFRLRHIPVSRNQIAHSFSLVDSYATDNSMARMTAQPLISVIVVN